MRHWTPDKWKLPASSRKNGQILFGAGVFQNYCRRSTVSSTCKKHKVWSKNWTSQLCCCWSSCHQRGSLVEVDTCEKFQCKKQGSPRWAGKLTKMNETAMLYTCANNLFLESRCTRKTHLLPSILSFSRLLGNHPSFPLCCSLCLGY